MEELTTLRETFSEKGLFEIKNVVKKGKVEREWEGAFYLSIEIEEIEREQVDFDGDVLRFDVLPLPATEILERQKPVLLWIPRDRLGINHERSNSFFDSL